MLALLWGTGWGMEKYAYSIRSGKTECRNDRLERDIIHQKANVQKARAESEILKGEVQGLTTKNRELADEKDQLHERIAQLESEAEHRDEDLEYYLATVKGEESGYHRLWIWEEMFQLRFTSFLSSVPLRVKAQVSIVDEKPPRPDATMEHIIRTEEGPYRLERYNIWEGEIGEWIKKRKGDG